jgi:hypothetical protein
MSIAQISLPDLHDIVLPDPVSGAPQTVGWWVLLGLVVVVLNWIVLLAARKRRANRFRRQALLRLAELEQALSNPASRSTVLTALPVLVKQTVLAAHSRSEVAALCGESWLHFLDRSYGGTGFTAGPGRLLPTLAYSAPTTTSALTVDELTALVDLVRLWIRRHHVRV